MNPFTLLKLGERDHMERLIEHGEVYCNTLAMFRLLENSTSPERADAEESLDTIFMPDQLSVVIEAQGIRFAPQLAGPFRVWSNADGGRNVFCLYGISELGPLTLDPRCHHFGSHAVFFKDATEFFRRVEVEAKRIGLKATLGQVEYVARARHDGRMGPFRKFDDFSHQNEVRIVFAPPTGKPQILRLGSLVEIAMLCEVKDLPRVNFTQSEVAS